MAVLAKNGVLLVAFLAEVDFSVECHMYVQNLTPLARPIFSEGESMIILSRGICFESICDKDNLEQFESDSNSIN